VSPLNHSDYFIFCFSLCFILFSRHFSCRKPILSYLVPHVIRILLISPIIHPYLPDKQNFPTDSHHFRLIASITSFLLVPIAMAMNGNRRQFSYPTPASTPPDNQDNLLTVLVSTRAVLTTPHNTLMLSPATITVSPATGIILSVTPAIVPPSAFPLSTTYIDHSPHILIPGLVDAHVHLNEPGRTEWEGFWTGTRAAASGGVTTVIDMPLNAIPPTTTLNGLKEKVRAAEGQCWVDVGFYGGIIPGNADQLLPLVEAGVRGFKGFLIASGVCSSTRGAPFVEPPSRGWYFREMLFEIHS